jgi:hypothetical protein
VGGTNDKAELTDLLLSMVERSGELERPIGYLSVPLTTGRAYLDWHVRRRETPNSSDVGAQVARRRVISANKQRAANVVGRLRDALPGTLIDPAQLLDVPGWEQPDYHALWVSVIEKYANTVIFIDEWQYSVGCTIEFAAAVRSDVSMLTERLTPLDVTVGVALIRSALAKYEAANLDSAPLSRSLRIAERATVQAAPRRN